MKQVIGILMIVCGIGVALVDVLMLILSIPGIIRVQTGPNTPSTAYAMGYIVGALGTCLVIALISAILIFFGRRLSRPPQPKYPIHPTYPNYPPRPY